ncbi:MAG: glucosidase family protein [Planctomycetota bacterium]
MRQVTVALSCMLLVCIGLICFGDNPAFAAHENNHDSLSVDFRYMPPEWQTAICFPDDPYKSIADRSGDLLYHYLRIAGGTDRFQTRIGIRIADNMVWKKQQLHSPRVPIVRTFLTADGLEVIEEAFAVADKFKSTKPEEAARNDLVLVHITNTGTVPRIVQPQLVVDTSHHFAFRPSNHQVVINRHETITSSLKMLGPAVEDDGKRGVIQLESLTVPAGKTETFFMLYSGGGKIVLEPATVEQALASRDRAVAYWQKVDLPYDRVQVPDGGIQALLDSSIRNIWQAREIKDGLPAFQVGPTCYRGLWIVDGAFLLEAATMLGAGDQARSGVAYEMKFQQPDGGIRVIKNYHKENGIVLWTCVRHAQLTQDKAWLESMWPDLERIAKYIKQLRARTYKNESPLDDGLNPPGFPDGGIGGNHYEYTNSYWNLLGLRAFIKGAQWLGKTEQAAVWQQEYDEFMEAFRRASARDMRSDEHGNRYLPVRMDGKDLPQRGQWAFCHAVYPGQIFSADDALVAGNMAMLEATERERMVYGTGWDKTGIWNYFASFYGHAWLWQGNGRKAAQSLYAFANHAAPMLVWREEQSLKGQEYRKVGDMPHNWASAEFIRLTVHMLALDRDNELHLFEGLPKEWVRAGMVTKLNGVATPFGKLYLTLKVDDSGKTARLKVQKLGGGSPERIVVHLDQWTAGAGDKVLSFAGDTSIDTVIKLKKQ